MAPNEKLYKQEVDPNRILEKHLKELRKTQDNIRDFRMHGRMGSVGLEQNNHPSNDERTDFAAWARKYSEKAGLYDKEKIYTDILGIIPLTMRALNSSKVQGSNRRTKKAMSEFNGVLRNTIDVDSSIAPHSITGLVQYAALSYGYEADEINTLVTETIRRQNTMRHELAFESILYYLPEGFEVLETTTEDDLDGIDSSVLAPNGAIVSFDVKATQKAANSSLEKAQDYYFNAGKAMPENRLILYSGFTDEDFEQSNPWRPKQSAIERVYPSVEAAIYKAAGMEHSQVPERVG